MGRVILDNKDDKQNGKKYKREALKGLKMGFVLEETYQVKKKK